MRSVFGHTWIAAVVLVTACGGDDGDGDPDANGGGGDPTCTVTADVTPDTGNRTITGVGMVSCSGNATIALEVCVQWNPSGTFADIMCQSGTMSGVMQHMVQNVSSCGISNGRRFRARVNASINGTAKNEVVTADVGCE